MALPLKWMPAYAHGGPFRASAPTCIVVHSTESDNSPAIAEAIAGPGWFGGPKAGTSAHKVVDVDSICEGVKRTVVAYHAGPGGNVRGVAYEFCGQAGWSAAKWREPAQLQMLRNAAPHIADDLIAITGSQEAALAACRWLSLAQLGGGQRGLCTHNDIRLVFGGTTHTDPGPNFPYAELLSYVAAELTGTPTQEDDMDPAVVKVIQETKNAVDALIGVAERPLEVEARLNVRLDALTGIVQQLATRQGTPIDMAAVEAVVEKGVTDAIAGIETTVTVKPSA